MTTRTFDVEHAGTHYPTDAQNKAALREVLKGEDLKLVGEPEFHLVENTSGGPSKVRATFEADEVKAPAKPDAKTDKTMTAGGSAPK